jgi:hypothetical protein
MTLLEVNLDGLFLMIFLVMFGPAILLGLISIPFFAKQKKKTGKVLLILAVVYLIVSLGICSSMML